MLRSPCQYSSKPLYFLINQRQNMILMISFFTLCLTPFLWVICLPLCTSMLNRELIVVWVDQVQELLLTPWIRAIIHEVKFAPWNKCKSFENQSIPSSNRFFSDQLSNDQACPVKQLKFVSYLKIKHISQINKMPAHRSSCFYQHGHIIKSLLCVPDHYTSELENHP